MHALLRLSILVAAFPSFISCMKEDVCQYDGNYPLRFEVSCSEFKISLSGGVHLCWTTGDRISVCEQIAADNQKGAIFTASASGAKVSFEGEMAELSRYYAVYPYEALKNWKNDGSGAAYVTIPSLQEALADDIDPSALIMCARSPANSRTLTFKPITSLVSFTIDALSPDIVEVTLSAPGQYLVGSASLNAAFDNPYTSGYGSKSSTVTLRRSDGTPFPEGEYYISVISRSYTGMELSFKDGMGRSESKTLPDCTLSPGTVYSAGVVKGILEKPVVETYKYSSKLKSSSIYRVWVEGEEQFVYPMYSDPEIDPENADRAHICTFGANGPVNVSIEAVGVSPVSVNVAPLGKHYSYSVCGNRVNLTLSPYDRVSVEINDLFNLNPLLVFVNPPETDKPDKTSDVQYYSAGYYNESHNGLNFTKTGKKTLYLEGGAVYRGNLAANSDSDITIAGYGILDNVDCWVFAINLQKCSNVRISGVTVLSAQASCTEFVECDGIVCDNCKTVATYNKRQKVGLENDGFDFFGSKNASISRCFAYAHDDLFAIDSKSFKKGWAGKVSNMSFDDCIGWNVRGGHFLSIGYATGEDISGVTCRNGYSIHSNMRTEGGTMKIGALGIHNGSIGKITDVTFENIYIEDPFRRPVGIEILKSPYDEFPDGVYYPGVVQGVTLKDIYVLKVNPLNEKSVIKGYDGSHTVSEVTFENFQLLGKRAASLDEADFTASYYTGVSFR